MNDRFIKTDDPSFVRDTATHAVLNTNAEAYKAYLHSRNLSTASIKLQDRVDRLQKDVEQMQQSLDTIINLLTKK